MYDVPAAASGDAGLEGFAVFGGSDRVGRVAAVNRTRDGLVLVVDTGDAYRVVPTGAVESIETRGGVVRVADGAEALHASEPVEVRVVRADSDQLVRHIPRELSRLLVEGEAPEADPRARRRVVGTALTYVGAIALFITAPVAAVVGSRSLRWLWVLVPLAVLVAGVAILWRAIDPQAGRPLTPQEKLADLGTFLLGISPQTRRRG